MKYLLLISAILTFTACQQVERIAETSDNAAEDATEISDAEKSEAEKAYAAANARMHKDMGVVHPDPDIAFMQGMVPHHQGAVDMAEIALKYGKDPEVRALAQAVIASQTTEIEQMNLWLKNHGVESNPADTVDHEAMDH